MSKIAIYPGTFDPITLGHIDVIKKALKIVDYVIVAISDGKNKDYLFGHGVKYQLPDKKILIGCYHPSPRNVNTGRLNEKKMIALFNKVLKLV